MAPARLATGLTLCCLALSYPESLRAYSFLEGSPCRPQIERWISEWHGRDEVLRAPDGPFGVASYRIATKDIGVWLTLQVARDPSMPTRLYRTAGTGSDLVEFSNHRTDGQICLESPLRALRPAFSEGSTGASATSAEGAFTDDDLKLLLAQHHQLVIYLWSPHMPLSVEGFAEIRGAASVTGFTLVALLHPDSDLDYAQREASAQGLPGTALRRAAAIELLFRDLLVHAPSVIVFSSGAASAVLPGFRTRAAYIEFLVELSAKR